MPTTLSDLTGLLAGLVVFVGIVLLVRSRFGPLRADGPHCGRCRHAWRGDSSPDRRLDPGQATACAECGADLCAPGGLRYAARRRRPHLRWIGAGLVVLAVGLLGARVPLKLDGRPAASLLPTSWLLAWATEWPASAGGARLALEPRVANGRVTRDELLEILDATIEPLQNATGLGSSWNDLTTGLGELLRVSVSRGLLDPGAPDAWAREIGWELEGVGPTRIVAGAWRGGFELAPRRAPLFGGFRSMNGRVERVVLERPGQPPRELQFTDSRPMSPEMQRFRRPRPPAALSSGRTSFGVDIPESIEPGPAQIVVDIQTTPGPPTRGPGPAPAANPGPGAAPAAPAAPTAPADERKRVVIPVTVLPPGSEPFVPVRDPALLDFVRAQQRIDAVLITEDDSRRLIRFSTSRWEPWPEDIDLVMAFRIEIAIGERRFDGGRVARSRRMSTGSSNAEAIEDFHRESHATVTYTPVPDDAWLSVHGSSQRWDLPLVFEDVPIFLVPSNGGWLAPRHRVGSDAFKDAFRDAWSTERGPALGASSGTAGDEP